MEKVCMLVIVYCFSLVVVLAQDSHTAVTKGAFGRISTILKDYQPDTSAAPDDSITRKIIELRNLKGGFNINEAIEYKLEEDRHNKAISAIDSEKAAVFFTYGDGKRWLNNAVIWIYRKQFTYEELQRLVEFYKTSAGRKMSEIFPVVMMESLKAAEMIKANYQQQKNK